MRKWYFEPIEDFQAEVGFKTEFVVEAFSRQFLHLWEVLEVEPGEKLVYRWRYGGLSGDSTVTWELAERDGGTQLSFSHDVAEPFPQDDPIFEQESCQAGWDFFLTKSLPLYLERAEEQSSK